MLQLILALILSLAGVLVLGPRVIPVLRKLKFGQTVYELGPQSHKTKRKDPAGRRDSGRIHHRQYRRADRRKPAGG